MKDIKHLLHIIAVVTILTGSMYWAEAMSKKPKEISTPTPAVTATPTPLPDVTPEPPSIKLAWDESPARAAWTSTLLEELRVNFETLTKAQDITKICPNYATLADTEKLKAWGELMVAIAYHESAWKPAHVYYEKTMGYNSEGLFQLSYEDEDWVKCGLDRSAKNLHDPEVNIKCAVKIMARQVSKFNKVLLNKGMYWAVIRDGGKYEKIKDITARVQKHALKCKGV